MSELSKRELASLLSRLDRLEEIVMRMYDRNDTSFIAEELRFDIDGRSFPQCRIEASMSMPTRMANYLEHFGGEDDDE